MKKQISTWALVALAVIFATSFTSCSKHKGFKEDKSGFYYKFYVQNDTAAQPQMGDVVDLMYQLRTADSTLLATVPIREQIIESLFEGDIFAAIRTMHVGDSATFILNGDTFFHYYMNQPFDFKNKDLYFDLKLVNITPKAEFEKIQASQKAEYEKMVEEFKLAEDSTLKNYISKNNIKVKPTADGLYYAPTKVGTGKQAEAGKQVTVHYTGKLMDGTTFDSSVERGEPFTFTLGSGQVIPGWDEGIALMKEGGKATLIIPSKLGYGERGAGYAIHPYAPLVFDVELIKVQ